MSRLHGVMGKFLGDEAGAVAIDWVAVTSGIMLLGVMVVYSIFNGGVASLADSMNQTLAGGLPDPSAVDASTDGGVRTGNAADQACITTGKYTVCMGPK